MVTLYISDNTTQTNPMIPPTPDPTMYSQNSTLKIPKTYTPSIFFSLNKPKTLKSNGTLSPNQTALCVWFLSSSSSTVFGCSSTLSGPRLTTSHGTNAPNSAGVKTLTSNMAIGCGPTGREKKV